MSAALEPAAAVLARITGFSAEDQAVLLGWLKQSASGKATSDGEGDALARLGGRDFSWPEFDRWQRFFAQRRQFPPLWDLLRRVPTPDTGPIARRAYETQKLYLLLDWLRGLVATRAETLAALARYARLEVGARITRQSNDTPCPVCDRLDRCEVGHPTAALPPFHPGCRCLVLPAVTPVPASPGPPRCARSGRRR